MTSVYQRRAKQAHDAKLALIRITCKAPDSLRPLIDLLSKDIWDKNYKMAEARCKAQADDLDLCPEIVDILCGILPGYAIMVDIRRKARGKL